MTTDDKRLTNGRGGCGTLWALDHPGKEDDMKTRNMLLAAAILISCAATLRAEDAPALYSPSREGHFTGRRIDLSVKDAELQEVARLIRELSGDKLEVDPSIASKRITLDVRNMPWDEALATALKDQHLGYEVEGDTRRLVPIVDDVPRLAMTRARLAADLGDRGEAIELFTHLSQDPRLPMDLRCEATVRKAALLVQSGQRSDGYTYYRYADSHCSDQPEAMRLLVEAVTGVEQDPETWRGRTEKFILESVMNGDGEIQEPRITYVADIPGRALENLPADGEVWHPDNFTGEPISISMKDADLLDVLSMFSAFSGMRIDPAEGVVGKASLELKDVPWDQALDLILQTNRLLAVKVDGGLRIEKLPDGDGVAP